MEGDARSVRPSQQRGDQAPGGRGPKESFCCLLREGGAVITKQLAAFHFLHLPEVLQVTEMGKGHVVEALDI